jgi:hypothetical protein
MCQSKKNSFFLYFFFFFFVEKRASVECTTWTELLFMSEQVRNYFAFQTTPRGMWCESIPHSQSVCPDSSSLFEVVTSPHWLAIPTWSASANHDRGVLSFLSDYGFKMPNVRDTGRCVEIRSSEVASEYV